MSFWSTQRIRAEEQRAKERREESLVAPFRFDRVGQGAYELTLSRQVLVSQNPEPIGQQLVDGLLNPDGSPPREITGTALTIPAGQFALLYSEETVRIPKNVLSFISIKAKIKLKGLVNISGFHVDPGFSGRLKFSVYNAGNKPICLTFGEPCFLLWFADLSGENVVADLTAVDVRPYDRTHSHNGQSGITAEDREQMSEPSQSPAALQERIKSLEGQMKIVFTIAALIIAPFLVGIAIVIVDHFITKEPVPDNKPSVGLTPKAEPLPISSSNSPVQFDKAPTR